MQAMLCGEEFRSLGTHFVRCKFECDNADNDEGSGDSDFEYYPKSGPDVRGAAGEHDLPLRCIRIVRFVEVFVVRNIPWSTISYCKRTLFTDTYKQRKGRCVNVNVISPEVR